MNWIALIAGLALLAVAGFAVWRAFQSPKFIGRLTKFASKQVWEAVKPEVARPMSEDDETKWHEAIRRGNDDEFQRARRGAPPKG